MLYSRNGLWRVIASCPLVEDSSFDLSAFCSKLTFLKVLCNYSLCEEEIAKSSILLLVLKRDGLDQSDPANYHPIANVTFSSKIFSHIVANQLIAYHAF